mgnify:CR=1 FL=1
MKPHIIIEPAGIVKVCCGRSECDVFLTNERLPISDTELIGLVKKYNLLVRRRCR